MLLALLSLVLPFLWDFRVTQMSDSLRTRGVTWLRVWRTRLHGYPSKVIQQRHPVQPRLPLEQGNTRDILSHLSAEHREAEALLDKLAESAPGGEREEILGELEGVLRTHMLVEERFVYPIVKEVVGAAEEEEAEIEHGLTRGGLAKMRELVAAPGFGAAVAMVKAGIKHHVNEEDGEIFPKLRAGAKEKIELLGDPAGLKAQLKSTGTKEELYEQAKEAGIPGRSKMSKAELEQALMSSPPEGENTEIPSV